MTNKAFEIKLTLTLCLANILIFIALVSNVPESSKAAIYVTFLGSLLSLWRSISIIMNVKKTTEVSGSKATTSTNSGAQE